MVRPALLALVAFTTACGAPGGGGTDGGRDAGQDAGSPDAGHPGRDALAPCAALQGTAVGSVAQMVARINALPHPVSGPCLLASLPRPLSIVATTSVNSAQPAVSAQSPRLFVLGAGLVSSFVPEGPSAQLLELGEWVTATRTLKGELELPVVGPVAASLPLTRIETGTSATTCGQCHRAEAALAIGDAGYVSTAYRPNPGTEVKLPALAAEHQGCVDRREVTERCDYFHALFDFGPANQGAFATAVELFL